MNDRKTLLLTASGILMAVLLVWAQLWTTTAQEYDSKYLSLITAGYGLLFVYYALVASLFSFLILLLAKLRMGLVFLLSALLITAGEVITSTWSVLVKTWSDPETLLEPSPYAVHFFTANSGWTHWILFVVAPIVSILICYLLVYIIPWSRTKFDSFLDS